VSLFLKTLTDCANCNTHATSCSINIAFRLKFDFSDTYSKVTFGKNNFCYGPRASDAHVYALQYKLAGLAWNIANQHKIRVLR